MKRAVDVILFSMLLTAVLTSAFHIRPVKSEPVTIIVPDEYPTIQEAIDHANSGDTVFVRAGTYIEHLEIDKSITLRGESNQNTTIRTLQRSGLPACGIRITASNVTLTGFNIIYHIPDTILDLVGIDARNGNCSGNTIQGNILIPGGETGVEIIAGSDLIPTLPSAYANRILDNLIFCGYPEGCGIVFASSNYNIADNNTITGGFAGILCLSFSRNNTISNNLVTAQVTLEPPVDAGAISFVNSLDNIVRGNRMVNNSYGVYCWNTVGNTIYHNNFVDNAYQTYTHSSADTWDNGYPSGGNYWSNYAGNDSYSGPFQNETGSDGLGDTAYAVDAVSRDNYPLMKPWTRVLGDVNGDERVDMLDILLVAKAFGSSPGDSRGNPHADVNDDGKVDIVDILLVARNFGKTHA
jgi:parallel beta-helix repeat protein